MFEEGMAGVDTILVTDKFLKNNPPISESHGISDSLCLRRWGAERVSEPGDDRAGFDGW